MAPSLRPPPGLSPPSPGSPAESQMDGGGALNGHKWGTKQPLVNGYGTDGDSFVEVDGEMDGGLEGVKKRKKPLILGEAERDHDQEGSGGYNSEDEQAIQKKRKRIRFAPLRIPLRRRLQTLSVVWHGVALTVCITAFWSICVNPLLWPLVLPYLVHLLLSSSHENGASPYIRSPLLRALPIWKYFNAYFPIRLHRTAPLPPAHNYIFGYQPHGIISIGAWGAFVADDGVQGPLPGSKEFEDGHVSVRGGGFGRLFPGIRNTLLTLNSNFSVPIYREYLLAMGLACVSKTSCEKLLRGTYVDRLSRSKPRTTGPAASAMDPGLEEAEKWTWSDYFTYLNPILWTLFLFRLLISLFPPYFPNAFHPYLPTQPAQPTSIFTPTSAPTFQGAKAGNAITIVLGGANESLLTFPHTYRLILNRRRGFLKLALTIPNTHLVPVLAFGENDLYETLIPKKGTWIWLAQRAMKKWVGWTVPVFWARGVFNYDVGIVPFRREVNVVVGKPVIPKRWRGFGERQADGVGEGESGEKERTGVPSNDEIDELQSEYIAELRRLWDEWKDVYAKNRKGELEIVE